MTPANEEPDSRVCYQVDVRDTIRSVNAAWNLFAAKNDAAALTAERVIGRSLWSYVDGEDVIAIYQSLLAFVRQRAQEVSFPYRCDSPNMKRFMVMNVVPLADEAIEFQNQTVGYERRNHEILVEYVTRDAQPYALRCSSCNRFRPHDVWLEVDEALAEGEILNSDLPLRVVNTLCERCQSKWPTAPSGS